MVNTALGIPGTFRFGSRRAPAPASTNKSDKPKTTTTTVSTNTPASTPLATPPRKPISIRGASTSIAIPSASTSARLRSKSISTNRAAVVTADTLLPSSYPTTTTTTATITKTATLRRRGSTPKKSSDMVSPVLPATAGTGTVAISSRASIGGSNLSARSSRRLEKSLSSTAAAAPRSILSSRSSSSTASSSARSFTTAMASSLPARYATPPRPKIIHSSRSGSSSIQSTPGIRSSLKLASLSNRRSLGLSSPASSSRSSVIANSGASRRESLRERPRSGSIQYLAHAKRKRRLTVKGSLPRTVPAQHVCGFANLGNTCFMNSALQCLLGSELLVSFFLYEQYRQDINTNGALRGHLAIAFGDMVQDIWTKTAAFTSSSRASSAHPIVYPHALKKEFDRSAPDHFMGNRQQDAQEFLRFLLDGLHEDLNRVKIRPRLTYDEAAEDALTEVEKANLSWNRYHACNDSFIFDVFGGQLQSTIHCLGCDYRSHTFETFWDLSLPIPSEYQTKDRRSMSSLFGMGNKTCSIQDCLRTFSEEETLDGEERYHCPKCKSPQRAKKGLRIYRFPEILVLHVKRFTQARYGREKLTTSITYAEELDGLSSVASDLEGGDAVDGYTLMGVCCHSGGLGGGHYVAHVKSVEDGQWYLHNDELVQLSTAKGHESSSYLLFYQRLHNHGTTGPSQNES